MNHRINLFLLAWLCSGALVVRAAEVAAGKVGVYDSRVVAFAHFWSAPERTERDALIGAARAAKQQGDAARQQELMAKIQALQADSHLQVFSTAPATAAMTALAPRLPDLARELGVARFVSKWDETALAAFPPAAQVDVTDRLAAEFKPDAQRQKTIEEMKRVAPLPLERAREMLKRGKL